MGGSQPYWRYISSKTPVLSSPSPSAVFPAMMSAALQAIQHSMKCALAGHHGSKSLSLSMVLC